MPEIAHKKTADMEGRYFPGDPDYRTGPVHTCLYVQVRETCDWDLQPVQRSLQQARAETGDLTEGY